MRRSLRVSTCRAAICKTSPKLKSTKQSHALAIQPLTLNPSVWPLEQSESLSKRCLPRMPLPPGFGWQSSLHDAPQDAK